MLATRCPLPITRHMSMPRSRRKPGFSKVCRSYYELDKLNSRSLDTFMSPVDMFYIITFRNSGDEGVYAVTENICDDDVSKNSIVAFTIYDDALRYKVLLEAELQNKTPYVQYVSRYDIKYMCNMGDCGCRVVSEGALVTPPTRTVKITDWERRQALLDGHWTVQEKDSDV